MDLRHAKDARGVDEAEKAVMRYPNCFSIVYQAAVMMQVFGLEQSDKALSARFDAAPCYDVTGICFMNMNERATFYDDMGATAMDAIGAPRGRPDRTDT